MLTTTTKSTHIHTYTYGYITRAFNRRRERLIHRQRLTSVDRRCSTILFFLLLHCVLTFESTIYLMQVYVRMYIGKKARRRRKRRKNFLNISQEKCDQNKRECISLSLSLDQILNIYDVDDEHCSGVYTYILARFPSPLLLLLLLLNRFKEKGAKLYA